MAPSAIGLSIIPASVKINMENTCQPATEIPAGGGICHIKAPKAEQKINLNNEGEQFCKNVVLRLLTDCCIIYFPNKVLTDEEYSI